MWDWPKILSRLLSYELWLPTPLSPRFAFFLGEHPKGLRLFWLILLFTDWDSVLDGDADVFESVRLGVMLDFRFLLRLIISDGFLHVGEFSAISAE